MAVALVPNNGVDAQSISTPIVGLLPFTTYHYRLKASNSNGDTRGTDQTFTTLNAPAVAGDLETNYDVNIGGGVVYTAATQPDGKTIIGGSFSAANGMARNCIARLNVDGSLDTGFNPNANGAVYSVAVQTNGRILLGGAFTTLAGGTCNRVARLFADGSLDTGFSPNPNGYSYSLAVQADGKILLAGNFTMLGTTVRNRLARVDADGFLDIDFNPSVAGGGSVPTVYCVAVQPDEHIILGGAFTSVGGDVRNNIARVAADGSLDPTFNPNANNSIYSIAIAADRKILLGGAFTMIGGMMRNRLARVDSDGAPDPGFTPAASGSVTSMAIQADGGIVLGGSFATVNDTIRKNVARLETDGSLDDGFNPNTNTYAYGVAIQADGKVVMGGSFTTVGGVQRTNFARIRNGGATETLTAPDSAHLLWSRGGTAPEVGQVTFDLSTDGGANWMPLGTGMRIGTSADWQLANLGLPASGLLRARGRTSGGYFNGSSGLVERVAAFTFYTPLQQWKLAHLGDANASDLADGDSDGLLTLAEYGLDLLPEAPSAPLQVMAFDYPDGRRLRLFLQRDPSHNDITIEVQAAGDATGPWSSVATSTLGAPFTGPGYVGGDDVTPGIKIVEVRDTANISDSEKHFLRAKITH
jgi:uncharacterized delta-60 repeat protein